MTNPTDRVVAIIPARGGSKGIPGKNVAKVGGVPLVGRAAAACVAASRVDLTVVSTDDEAIAAAARAAGARVIDRPAEIAGDTATSESALVHALEVLAAEGVDPEVVVFVQATSPFIDVEGLDRAVGRVVDGDEDVVFSAFETYGFLWRITPDGADGVNHDKSFRPRRQDREAHYEENGAFYVMDRAGFLAAGHRFFGKVGIEPTSRLRSVEIDDRDELELSRLLAGILDPASAPVGAKALVMDFDGVHTDDKVTVDQNGVESVTVSRSDGMGIGLLRKAGVPMLILSKERNPVVAARAAKLGVEVAHGVDDKLPALLTWCEENGLDPQDVAYIGNDINDEACLRNVGWPVVVPDSHPSIRTLGRVALSRAGGDGALRELAELILAGRKES